MWASRYSVEIVSFMELRPLWKILIRPCFRNTFKMSWNHFRLSIVICFENFFYTFNFKTNFKLIKRIQVDTQKECGNVMMPLHTSETLFSYSLASLYLNIFFNIKFQNVVHWCIPTYIFLLITPLPTHSNS